MGGIGPWIQGREFILCRGIPKIAANLLNLTQVRPRVWMRNVSVLAVALPTAAPSGSTASGGLFRPPAGGRSCEAPGGVAAAEHAPSGRTASRRRIRGSRRGPGDPAGARWVPREEWPGANYPGTPPPWRRWPTPHTPGGTPPRL
eukprot:gene16233-biopygen9777